MYTLEITSAVSRKSAQRPKLALASKSSINRVPILYPLIRIKKLKEKNIYIYF